jgi:hypothetical protein
MTPSSFGRLTQDPFYALDVALQAEALTRSCPSGAAELPAKSLVVSQTGKRYPQTRNVTHVHQKSRFLIRHHLGRPTAAEGSDGQSRGHGFEDRARERIRSQRAQGDHVGGGQQRFGGRPRREQVDPLRGGVGAARSSHALAIAVRPAPGNDEP